eukprot:4603358-Pyramimonas_sp.AAC.1
MSHPDRTPYLRSRWPSRLEFASEPLSLDELTREWFLRKHNSKALADRHYSRFCFAMHIHHDNRCEGTTPASASQCTSITTT